MFTTMPCRLSFATGCAPASTSWTVPWILAAHAGSNAASTIVAIVERCVLFISLSFSRENADRTHPRDVVYKHRAQDTTNLPGGQGALSDPEASRSEATSGGARDRNRER